MIYGLLVLNQRICKLLYLIQSKTAIAYLGPLTSALFLSPRSLSTPDENKLKLRHLAHLSRYIHLTYLHYALNFRSVSELALTTHP